MGGGGRFLVWGVKRTSLVVYLARNRGEVCIIPTLQPNEPNTSSVGGVMQWSYCRRGCKM